MKRIKGRKREAVPTIRAFGDPVLKSICEPVCNGEDVTPRMKLKKYAVN